MALGLALGVSATLVLRGHLARLEAQAAAGGPGVPVVLATRDLVRGTVLDRSALEVGQMPGRYSPAGAIRSVDEAAGRVLAADVSTGEVLTAARVAPPGGPVASLVPPGLRAVPVTAPLPPGALSPGDRVDVLATFATGPPHTETVVENVEVLLVLEGSEFEEVAAATVVLLVEPETAERLAYARAFADLTLAIASPVAVPTVGPEPGP